MFNLLVISILLADGAEAAKYVGCFEDPNHTDLPGITISDKKVKKCINFCMSEDYRASAYRKGCYCGESFRQGPLPEGRCYAYCPGAPAEECVSKYTDSVWYTGEKEGSDSASSESSEVRSRQLEEAEGLTIYLGTFETSSMNG